MGGGDVDDKGQNGRRRDANDIIPLEGNACDEATTMMT
jgi:hypothetical protein